MSPFEIHRRAQAHDHAAIVAAQADRALEELRARGAVIHLVGSLAKGKFKLHSDADFLIDNAAGMSDGEIFNILTNHVRNAKVDMVFAERQSTASLKILREGVTA